MVSRRGLALSQLLIAAVAALGAISCSGSGGGGSSAQTPAAYSLSADFTRIDQVGYSPFQVKAYLKDSNGQPVAGKTLSLTIPSGTVSPITDNGDGSYTFTVTPQTSGSYPVEIDFGGATYSRKALVMKTLALGTGVGQPLEIPGTMFNTEGWEDGITISPDGQYLFMQYGPIYFSGLANLGTICYNPSYSLYDILGCSGKTDSDLVFNTVGPYNSASRPNFPSQNIVNGKFVPLNIVISGVANGLPDFPTVFYGFKKQSDGTFAQPFKVAFNDPKGLQGPYGLSFQMTGPNTANFVMAWQNAFNDAGGDQKPDIYYGSLTFGVDKNLGDVTYSGDSYASISPNVSLMPFASHVGVQGNPHLYVDGAGAVKSIWTDDEQVSHDLSVYVLTSGTFPGGTWSKVALPSVINTTASESQPFFTGQRLYMNRETKIVYHEYLGSGGNDYGSSSSWGPEHVVLSIGDVGVGTLYGVGEPTLVTVNGKTLLYFVVVKARSQRPSGVYDYNLDGGFVELQ